MAHTDEFEDEDGFEREDLNIEDIQDKMGREKYYISIFADAVPDSQMATYEAIQVKADRLVAMVKDHVLSDQVDVPFELDNGFFNNKETNLETGAKALVDTINKLAPDAFSPDTLTELSTAYMRAKHLQYAGDRYIEKLAEGDESGQARRSFIDTIEKALGSAPVGTKLLVGAFEDAAAAQGIERPGKGR